MTKLCARGKAAADAKYAKPSAYKSGFGVLVCKGKAKGLDGRKLNSYARGVKDKGSKKTGKK